MCALKIKEKSKRMLKCKKHMKYWQIDVFKDLWITLLLINLQWDPVVACKAWLTTLPKLRKYEKFPVTFRWCYDCDWTPQNRPLTSRSNWNMHTEVAPPSRSTGKHQCFLEHHRHSFQQASHRDLTPYENPRTHQPSWVSRSFPFCLMPWSNKRADICCWEATFVGGVSYTWNVEQYVKRICEVSQHP